MTPKDFRIGNDRDLGGTMMQLLNSQLDTMGKFCLEPMRNREKNVHEIRKVIKRSRTLLKLVRDSIGYAGYYRENQVLRAHHRSLGRSRELDVLRVTMAEIHQRYSGLFSEILYDDILDRIQEEQKNETALLRRKMVYQRIAGDIEAMQSRLPHYVFREEGFRIIEGGLKRTYRQGRNQMASAFAKDAEPFQVHEFRKKGKYLYYQLELLRPAFPRVLKAYARIMEKLTDLLGEYNDLHHAELIIPGLFEGRRYPRRSISTLFDLFVEERERLKRVALAHSEHMYVEDPEQFIFRVRSYWETFVRKSN